MAVPKSKKIKEIMGLYEMYAKKYSNLLNTYRDFISKREEKGIKGPKIKKATLRDLPEVPLFYLNEKLANEFLSSLSSEELDETLRTIERAVDSYSYRTINEMIKFFIYDEKRREKTKKGTSYWGSIDPDKTVRKIRSSKKYKDPDDL